MSKIKQYHTNLLKIFYFDKTQIALIYSLNGIGEKSTLEYCQQKYMHK